MIPEIPGVLLFAVIALPIVFAWHSLVSNYLFASFLATINILILVSALLLLNRSVSHHLGSMLLMTAGSSFALSLAVGSLFHFFRSKKLNQK